METQEKEKQDAIADFFTTFMKPTLRDNPYLAMIELTAAIENVYSVGLCHGILNGKKSWAKDMPAN